MDISPNTLRRETAATLKSIDAVIEAIKQDRNKTYACLPEELVDRNGNWVLAPLLLAKAQCLNTLALLNQKAK